MNTKNEILLLLTDKWCDWEASYAIAVLSSYCNYSVKTIAVDKNPKISMGNLSTNIDYCINELSNLANIAMIILPGGLSWENNDSQVIVEFIHQAIKLNIPVAAICGATTFLCKNGLLDNVKHTGDSLELFKSQIGYQGEVNYVEAQVVVDHGIITANETAAVEFAYEIFKLLGIESDETLTVWNNNFQYGAIRK